MDFSLRPSVVARSVNRHGPWKGHHFVGLKAGTVERTQSSADGRELEVGGAAASVRARPSGFPAPEHFETCVMPPKDCLRLNHLDTLNGMEISISS
jgi:hypothetical protein